MCKRKRKQNGVEDVANVGTSGYIAQKTIGSAQVRPPGNIGQTPSSASIESISSTSDTALSPSKGTTRKKVLTGLEIVLKVLHGLRIAAMTIGFILALFTLLGFLYMFLAIAGVVEPDPHAFFASWGF